MNDKSIQMKRSSIERHFVLTYLWRQKPIVCYCCWLLRLSFSGKPFVVYLCSVSPNLSQQLMKRCGQQSGKQCVNWFDRMTNCVTTVWPQCDRLNDSGTADRQSIRRSTDGQLWIVLNLCFELLSIACTQLCTDELKCVGNALTMGSQTR